MRSTRIWARRATAALLSLAMATGGAPPAALAEALEGAGDGVRIESSEVDAKADRSDQEDPVGHVQNLGHDNGNSHGNETAQDNETVQDENLDLDNAHGQGSQEQPDVPITSEEGPSALQTQPTEPADVLEVVGDDDVAVTVQGDAYAVTVAEGIQNGTLETDVAEAEEGATVTLTVTPSDGYALASLAVTQTEGGDTVDATPGEAPGTYTVQMPAAAITATATFAEALATVTTADGTSTPYAERGEALAAWTDGCTLTLLADWNHEDDYISIDGNGDRTLDLNGHGVSTHYWYNEIYDNGSGTGSLAIVDGNPDVEHRYNVNPNGRATVDDGLAEGYQTFHGGYISSSYYSAIYLESSTLTMTGGTIIGCPMCGIRCYGGTLLLDGTTITGNTGNYSYEYEGYYPSGLGMWNANATLKNVTVTGNVDAVDYMGAVYSYGSGSLTVSGSTTILGNYGSDGTTPNNLYLREGAKLTVAGPLTGSIGVHTDGKGTFTSGLAGNGVLSNLSSEMGDVYQLALTDEGEAQFELPEGVLAIPSSGSETYDMTGASVGDKVNVYDARGTWDYCFSWDGTLTIVPPAGKALRVTGSVDTQNNHDYLGVYETSTGSDALAYVSGEGKDVDITVTDDPLVLRFYSNNDTNGAGVELTVEVVEPPAEYPEDTKYTVICESDGHGTASVDKASTWEGKLVTITATPDEGYLLSGITVNDEPIETDPYQSTYTFTMPAQNSTVSATFGEAATVTFLDGDTEVSSVTVLIGSPVTEPEVATRKGMALMGWARDGRPFDLSTPITEDTTLDAVWVEGTTIREDFSHGKPDDWTQDGYEGWSWGTYHGEPMAYHSYDYGTQSRLIMPPVDLSSPTVATLSFAYMNRADGSYIDQLGVDYRVGQTGEWKTIFLTEEAHEEWTPQSIDLLEAIPEEDRTGEVYFAFHGYGNYGWCAIIDNVNLVAGGHDWSYAADDEADVITATCGNGADVCTVAGARATVALSAEDAEYTGDPVEATVSADDAWTQANGLAGYVLEYFRGGAPLGSAPTELGTYTARLTVGEGDGAVSVSKDFSITDKISVKATGTTCTYDGKAHGIDVSVATPGATTTYAESEDGEYAAEAPAYTDAGTYTVWYRVSKRGYTTRSGSADVVIRPRTVGISWTATNLTYTGERQAPRATATGLVAGDSVTVAVAGAKKDVGTYTATATGLSSRNYCLPGTNTSKFTIAKAKLTVTARDKAIKYGAAPANAGVTYSGLKGSDTAKSLGGTLAYGYGGYRKGSKAGTYRITPSGLSSKNYAIAYRKGTLTVKAPATVATTGQVRADGKGWIKSGANGMFGTTGQSRRTTGIRIALGSLPYAGGIEYRGHFETSGWQKAWTKGNGVCAVGDKRLEAVQVRLTGAMAKGYDVYYRVHTQKLGWMAWTSNGESAGTTTQSDRLEAVQVVVQLKGGPVPAKNYKGIKQTYAKPFTTKV